ncbi:MAG: glycerol-3-phosphate acyltransferase [Anaerolineae bacterium]|nr:glycerol-3-phosphate acyltransferase [Anaerolineae bacterium]
METILWTIGAFFLGAIPFSPLVSRYALGKNLREVGDGNPGATNVVKAGGVQWGILAFALDYLKGALPPGIAWFFAGIQDWRLVPIAVAPVAGHAFSPFLNFKGGKALAATFGVWSGLTLAEVPTMLGLMMTLFFIILTIDGWAVVLALLPLSIYMLVYKSTVLFAVWAGIFAIVAYKHRADLYKPLRLKPWIKFSR